MGAHWDLRPEGMLKSGCLRGPAHRSGQRVAQGWPPKLRNRRLPRSLPGVHTGFWEVSTRDGMSAP